MGTGNETRRIDQAQRNVKLKNYTRTRVLAIGRTVCISITLVISVTHSEVEGILSNNSTEAYSLDTHLKANISRSLP